MDDYFSEYEKKYSHCIWIPFEKLESFMKDALVASGVPEGDAQIVSDVLITSDKRGIDSHGIGRLKPIYIDRIDAGILNPVTKMEIVKDEKACVTIDGHNGMGHVVARKAMEMAIEKAEEYGLGMAVVRNSTHYGIAGYYATMATEKNMIGITGTNARPSIAPTFGVENMMGTNPLTFALPTDEAFPFVLDCATSVTQRGKIEVYGRAGKDLPHGWVIDENGNDRTDTAGVLEDLTKGKAALTPLGGIGEENGGYKGYGYAAVVEILSAALQDGSWMKALNGRNDAGRMMPYPLGHFFIAINPAFFMGTETFRLIAGTICRQLRASRKAPGEDRIFTAGEKEYLAWQYRKIHGCPVPPSLQKVIKELTSRFRLDYSWEF